MKAIISYEVEVDDLSDATNIGYELAYLTGIDAEAVLVIEGELPTEEPAKPEPARMISISNPTSTWSGTFTPEPMMDREGVRSLLSEVNARVVAAYPGSVPHVSVVS